MADKRRPTPDPFEKLPGQVSEEPEARLPLTKKSKRDRSWEKEKRQAGEVATYRGVPPALQEEIRGIADNLQVPIGEVARALLEQGLADYKAGNLHLERRLRTGKYTLFPGKEE
jgi:hypothetical protein